MHRFCAQISLGWTPSYLFLIGNSVVPMHNVRWHCCCSILSTSTIRNLGMTCLAFLNQRTFLVGLLQCCLSIVYQQSQYSFVLMRPWKHLYEIKFGMRTIFLLMQSNSWCYYSCFFLVILLNMALQGNSSIKSGKFVYCLVDCTFV